MAGRGGVDGWERRGMVSRRGEMVGGMTWRVLGREWDLQLEECARLVFRLKEHVFFVPQLWKG